MSRTVFSALCWCAIGSTCSGSPVYQRLDAAADDGGSSGHDAAPEGGAGGDARDVAGGGGSATPVGGQGAGQGGQAGRGGRAGQLGGGGSAQGGRGGSAGAAGAAVVGGAGSGGSAGGGFASGGANTGGAATGGIGGGGVGPGGAAQGGQGGKGGGSGGTAGSAGSCKPVGASDMMISSFEGGRTVSECSGCVGYWYPLNDGTGTQLPPASTMVGYPLAFGSGACASGYAIETSGDAFTSWAALAVDLNQAGATKSTYDASAFTGVAFRARTAAAGSKTNLVVLVGDDYSEPEGGKCSTSVDAGAGTKCYDAYKTPSSLTIGSEWADYAIWFADLRTEGWGLAAKPMIDAAKLYGIQFRFVTTPQVPLAFDVFFDDVRFVK